MKFPAPKIVSLTSALTIFLLVFVQFPLVSLAFDSDSNQTFFSFSSNQDDKLAPQVVFSNASSISITDRASGAGAPNGTSVPYPSTIAVSGLSGTISSMTVTLNNVSLPRITHNDFALVGPNGTALMLMSDAGDTDGVITAVNNINLTFSDAAATLVPNGSGVTVTSGTYRPTDANSVTTNNDVFPAEAGLPGTIGSPAPNGVATLASSFNGINPNGTWRLYAIDDALGGGASTIAGGWSLDITTAGGVAATTTTISSSLNPSLTTQNVTFTATVTSVGNPVTVGNVSFTQNSVAIAGCSNVALNGSGQAVCTANAGTLPEGTRTITATYNGTGSFGVSSGNVSQTINSTTVVTGSQFCNNGGITLPDTGAATPYGSNVVVSGLVGTISKVTVRINGLTVPRTQDTDMLLVGPGSRALHILSDVGDASAISNVNLVFDDTAGSALPIGSPISSGTFRPTDNNVVGQPENFPAPAPAITNAPAPNGSSTLASVYNGIEANGTWTLYIVDDSLGGGTGSIGSYCVDFTLSKFNTTTTLTSSRNPVPQNNDVTFTATVSNPSALYGDGNLDSIATSGNVQFFDGATSLGISALNGAGQATLTLSGLPIGNRNITAQYLGANVGAGGGGFNPSTSAVLVQQILPATAANAEIGGRVLDLGGQGIGRAMVTLTDTNGLVRTSMTNSFGYYRFTEIPSGENYVINVNAKGRTFTPQIVTVLDSISDLNLVESK